MYTRNGIASAQKSNLQLFHSNYRPKDQNKQYGVALEVGMFANDIGCSRSRHGDNGGQRKSSMKISFTPLSAVWMINHYLHCYRCFRCVLDDGADTFGVIAGSAAETRTSVQALTSKHTLQRMTGVQS